MADSSSEEKTEKPSAQKCVKRVKRGNCHARRIWGWRRPVCGVCGDLQQLPVVCRFCGESFISVHQYAQEINNPDVIASFCAITC